VSFGEIIGRTPYATRAGLLNNAEIVVWQSARRSLIALGIGVLGVALRGFGLVTGPAWPLLVAVPTYIGVVALLTLLIERRGQVSRAALNALAVSDVVAVFVTVALITPPAFYPRALFLSLLALQFTQMFFPRTPSITVLVTSLIGYAALIAGARHRGMQVDWVEQGWMVLLYIGVALNGMALQASAHRRLAAIVDLCSGAQRGDFSRAFIEARDAEPDGITLLGRAYNHLRSELASMVMSDTLTGCLNRRGFDLALDDAIRAAARRGGMLSLLAIDIDHFKSINDTAGHLAGDAVLRELVALVTRVCDSKGRIARIGGEEFVVLLPGDDAEQAGVMAERVSSSVRAHNFRTARSRIGVTVSIGVATEQVTDSHLAAALRARADEALYVAKRLGRDRVVMWAPGIRSNATPPFTSVISLV
jgi:diguanylate cyclase (GGDEF)-like protein